MPLAASALIWILTLAAWAPPAAPPSAAPTAAPSAAPTATPPAATLPRVLVFSRAADYYHKSIPAGIQAVREIGGNLFAVDATDDSTAFTTDNLKKYRAVVFLNTTGDALNPDQQTAFEGYIRAGHGYAGVHSAADTEYDWPWYGHLVGAYFKGHPDQQQATVKVEDRTHRSTRALPATWVRMDEWYSFRTNPRADVHVLASLDETTYKAGALAMGDHPIAWCHEFDGGRAWYTALGHTNESYADPLFRTHLREGIAWAAGLPEPVTVELAAPPAAPAAGAPVTPAPTPGKSAPAGTPAPTAPPAAAPATPPAPAAPPAPKPHAAASILPLATPTLAALPTAITLAGGMVIMIIILGAMGQGIRAPILAWLWPGLGHFSLGYRRRAMLAMIGVLGMFVTGLAVGGVDAVDSQEDAAWFVAQAGNGPIAFGADALNQGVLKTGKIGTLINAPPALNGSPLQSTAMISNFKGIGAANEFGTLFIALGGLMNLILVMDCARREPASNAKE